MPDVAATFSALSDATRLAIVESLIRHGPQNAGQLGSVSAISAPAISRHLRVLREAGVIEQRIDGQKRVYSARAEALQVIHQWALDHRNFWQAGLDQLDIALQEERPDA